MKRRKINFVECEKHKITYNKNNDMCNMCIKEKQIAEGTA